jgi:hypothetical protein
LTEPGGGDRNIRWAPAKEFVKVLDLNETAVLRWVEIDTDAADRDHVKWFVHDRTSAPQRSRWAKYGVA